MELSGRDNLGGGLAFDWGWGGTGGSKARQSTEIASPASVCLVMDMMGPNNDMACCVGYGVTGNACGSPAFGPVDGTWANVKRHNGGFNIAFVDGHVKWLNASKVPTGPNSGFWAVENASAY